jgi:hypothetical protein
MPAQYEAIRNELLKRHLREEEAKRRAAMIYISQGKTPEERSARAKALHDSKKESY